MTIKEAKSLVLREGISDNATAPEDALFIMLHRGYPLDHEQVHRLIEAVDTVHKAIKGEAILDRRLAGAMWTLGVEANRCLQDERLPAEQDDLTALFYALERAVHDY